MPEVTPLHPRKSEAPDIPVFGCGAVVTLKGATTRMTVKEPARGYVGKAVRCCWFSTDDCLQEDVFPVAMLIDADDLA